MFIRIQLAFAMLSLLISACAVGQDKTSGPPKPDYVLRLHETPVMAIAGFGSTTSGRFNHWPCPPKTATCRVPVFAAVDPRDLSGKKCLIDVADVVKLGRDTTAIEWGLSNPDFSFVGTYGVRVDRNTVDDASDPDTDLPPFPARTPVFGPGPAASSPSFQVAVPSRLLRAFTYSILLQHTVAGQNIICDLLDPIIVNRE